MLSTISKMFSHEQGPQKSSLLSKHSLPPLCLPKQRRHSKSVGESISFRHETIDNARYRRDAIPEHQCFRSRNQRPRGGSLEEENVYSRTMLPSMASLMPSHTFQLQHANSIDENAARQHFHRQETSLKQVPSANHHAQLRSLERTRFPMTSASSLTKASNLHVLSTSFTRLSASSIEPIEMQRNRFAMPLNHRQNRWSPYASTGASIARESFCAISWDHVEDQNKQQNPHRRRTSPRRRLAASKVRAHAFRMQELAEVFDHFENNCIGYDPAKQNDKSRVAPSFSTVSSKLRPSMFQSPIFVNDSNLGQNKQRVELRE